MTSEHAGPTATELLAMVQRLAADLSGGALDRSGLLQIEITLRGMLPQLEGMLQYHVHRQGQSDRADEASRAVVTLAGNLEWIQLNAHAPIPRIHLRLTESVHCAELALQRIAD